MEKKQGEKNILSALVIAGSGVVLYFAAFSFAAFVMNIVSAIAGTKGKPPVAGLIVFLVLIALISWLVFRSKFNDRMKAAYLTMPVMIALVVTGLLLYPRSQWLIAGVGALIVGSVCFCLYKTKRSWMYYFATLYSAVIALIIMLTGVEI